MSDRLRRVAALACGLLWLVVLPEAAAAGHHPGKPAASRKKSAPHPRAANPSPQFGAADVIDESMSGLHGLASYYGYGFQGRRTATGERFDVGDFTAASNRFPLGALVAVGRVDDARCAVVKVNDRMHVKHRRRVIDVSRGVAEYLGMLRAGVVLVRVAALRSGRAGPGGDDCRAAVATAPQCERCEPPAVSDETSRMPPAAE